MIPDLNNIVLEFAKIKKDKNKYLNYCNKCYKYKCEEMKNVDLMFYQIKLSFVLEKVFHGAIDKHFQEILKNSEIQTTLLEPSSYSMDRFGWVTNSMEMENYWYKINNLRTVEDIMMNRPSYLEFITENFIFIGDRNFCFCSECWLNGKKIKLD